MGASMATGGSFAPRNSFTRILFLTVFCFVLFIYTFKPSSMEHIEHLRPPQMHPQPNNSYAPERQSDCTLKQSSLMQLQDTYDLGDEIEYARRYVRFHRQDIPRKAITKLDTDLFPRGFDSIDIRNPPPRTTCLKPIDVPVPRSPIPNTVNASELLFGISTTYSRLTDEEISPINEWAHWLTDGNGKSNGAGLILRLIDASKEELEEARHVMASMGMDVKVYPTDSSIEMAKRYLSLLPALYKDSSRPNRKFLVLGDDDTFYPSMHSLLHELSQYDHKKDLYLGTLSEDTNNIARHGSQAFGGAGVFFSLSLAKKVADKFDHCSTNEKIDESDTGWGPKATSSYENAFTRTPRQHSRSCVTSINSTSKVIPRGSTRQASNPYHCTTSKAACGTKRGPDDFIISNGFSIAYYPHGVDFNLHQMEKTFTAAPDDYGWNLDFMLGPQRKNLLWTGRKVAWELMESLVQHDGSVKQIYIRKADDYRWTYGKDGNRMFDKDGVLELIWISS
ncbi:hypothetical protein LSUB1_G002996 [Lachnellula subtilissima]|uniref:Fringe-like glycosyltransferase domain-containing protein n=1 Tax=Lachnellula subtilissima TaxID=602034 RepID=A0A8H8UFL5_9HELO|nr:hypothetical protein LSUB1_G002996 [Lachnellula subtilissima]